MALSPLKALREKGRQLATGDSFYYKRLLNFFELRVPQEVAYGVVSEFFFPLIIPPESMRVEEPFTVELTPTQGGGLYAEENGIVQRMIVIRGHTGFKPRVLKGNGTFSLFTTSPEKKSYSRQLPGFVPDLITGQRHFQYLQDAVFRTYGDLKRDPATAEETKLIFHIPKDDEHWLVVPQSFTLERDAAMPHIYNYTIELAAVDKATALDQDFSEDRNIFDKLRDAVRTVKAAIDMVSGAFNDLSRIVGALENFIKDIAKIIGAIGTVLDAARDFVNGVTDLIQAPLALLDSTLGVIDSSLEAWDALKEANEDIREIPDTVLHKFDEMRDGLELFLTHPEKFETPLQIEARKRKERSVLLRDITQQRREEAEASTAPSTIEGWAALGTTLTPGDVESAEGELFSAILAARYSSAQLVTVGQGDTLTNLATRYLGDGRKWEDIADSNNLEGPFLDEQASKDLQIADEAALPSALGVGDTVLVPNFSRSITDRPILSVLGVRPTEDPLVHLLGRDVAAQRTESTANRPPSAAAPRRPQYDLPVDIAGGSIDAQSASGIANLSQGLLYRVTTERGSDPLYRRVGLARISGVNQAEADLEISRFKIAECLEADGRIAAVRGITFDGLDGGETPTSGQYSLDTLIVDAELEVFGFAERANVRLAI